jgi:hypothetical protein
MTNGDVLEITDSAGANAYIPQHTNLYRWFDTDKVWQAPWIDYYNANVASETSRVKMTFASPVDMLASFQLYQGDTFIDTYSVFVTFEGVAGEFLFGDAVDIIHTDSGFGGAYSTKFDTITPPLGLCNWDQDSDDPAAAPTAPTPSPTFSPCPGIIGAYQMRVATRNWGCCSGCPGGTNMCTGTCACACCWVDATLNVGLENGCSPTSSPTAAPTATPTDTTASTSATSSPGCTDSHQRRSHVRFL